MIVQTRPKIRAVNRPVALVSAVEDHARAHNVHRNRTGVRHRKTGEAGGLESLDRIGGDVGQGVGEARGEVHRGNDGSQGDGAAGNRRDVIGLAEVVAEGEREAERENGDGAVVHVHVDVDELGAGLGEGVARAPPGVGEVTEEHVQKRCDGAGHRDRHDGDKAVTDGDEVTLIADPLRDRHELGLHPVHETVHG